MAKSVAIKRPVNHGPLGLVVLLVLLAVLSIKDANPTGAAVADTNDISSSPVHVDMKQYSSQKFMIGDYTYVIHVRGISRERDRVEISYFSNNPLNPGPLYSYLKTTGPQARDFSISVNKQIRVSLDGEAKNGIVSLTLSLVNK